MNDEGMTISNSHLNHHPLSADAAQVYPGLLSIHC